MESYDVIVIGGGPAGYRAALELDKRNKKVLLIEKNKLGGTCLNEGCIPAKSYLNSAYEYLFYRKFVDGFDYREAFAKKKKDIDKLLRTLESKIEKSGIRYINGYAQLTRNGMNEKLVKVNGQEFTADDVIIATGSRALELEIEGLDAAVKDGRCVYSREFFELEEVCGRILIIGGGVTGVEFASYLNTVGCDVAVIETRESILGDAFDGDLKNKIIASFEKKGVRFLLNARVEEIEGNTMVYNQGGMYHEMEFDKIVIAAGRMPDLEGVDVTGSGLWLDGAAVKTDLCCRTSIDGIYACGDVSGKIMLAHVAYKEAEVAVANICGEEAYMQYDIIPSVVYSNPELASVGKTVEQMMRDGVPYQVREGSMFYSGRYMISNASEPGWLRLVFNMQDVLEGAQIIGNGAAELIMVIEELINQRVTAEAITKRIFPHPSVAEVIKEIILENEKL